MFTARSFGPEEAKEMGIVYETHPEDVLMERAMEFAAVSGMRRGRHTLTKNALNQSPTSMKGRSASSKPMRKAWPSRQLLRRGDHTPQNALEFDWDKMAKAAKSDG